MNPDFDKINPASRSAINLDSGDISSDLGLGSDYCITELYSDFMLAEYLDISKQGFVDCGDGLYQTEGGQKEWRKAIIRKVGHLVKTTHVGDIVTFPNDKGLRTSKVKYLDENGTPQLAEDGIFLNEWRVFAKLKKE